MKKKLLFLLVGLCLLVGQAVPTNAACTPSAGQAVCNTISNNDTGAATRSSLNYLFQAVYNVKEYKATGDGTTDDTTFIQNAITAACAAGTTTGNSQTGGVVLFPPGNYITTAPLTACSGNGSLALVGSGRHSTRITGSFAGYIIDKPDNGLQNLERIEHIGVINNRQNLDAGGIRCNACEKTILSDLLIGAFTGIEIASNSYVTAVYNTEITNPFPAGTPGTVGIYMAQAGVYQTRIVGYDTCIVAHNAGVVISGSACETSNLALNFGDDRPNVFTASINGSSKLIVSAFALGPGITSGSYVSGTGITPFATTVVSQDSGTPGGIGTYTIAGSPGVVGSEQMATIYRAGLQGFLVSGFQTERANVGIAVNSAAAGSVVGSTFTGTVGVPVKVTTGTWSSGTGLATLTTIYPHGQSGSADCTVQNVSPSGYNGEHMTCNYINTTQVTYSISDPGGSAVPGNDASVSPLQAAGMYICNGTGLKFDNVSFGMTVPSTSIDLQCGGFFSGAAITFDTVRTSNTWSMPTGVNRAQFKYINSTNPTAAMQFADLPGQASVSLATPVEGMEYDLTNCTIADSAPAGNKFGGVVTTGGAVHCKVRYNGTNWTAMGM